LESLTGVGKLLAILLIFFSASVINSLTGLTLSATRMGLF